MLGTGFARKGSAATFAALREIAGVTAEGLSTSARKSLQLISVVITSYSIHYTKLYEMPSAQRASPSSPPSRLV